MCKYTFKSLYKNKIEIIYQILVVYFKYFNFILMNLTPGGMARLLRPHYSPAYFPLINSRRYECARGLTRDHIITLSVLQTESFIFDPQLAVLQSEYGILKAFIILKCVIPVVCRKTNGGVNVIHETTTMVVWIYDGI